MRNMTLTLGIIGRCTFVYPIGCYSHQEERSNYAQKDPATLTELTTLTFKKTSTHGFLLS